MIQKYTFIHTKRGTKTKTKINLIRHPKMSVAETTDRNTPDVSYIQPHEQCLPIQ